MLRQVEEQSRYHQQVVLGIVSLNVDVSDVDALFLRLVHEIPGRHHEPHECSQQMECAASSSSYEVD